jgi:hypothetical protein
MLKGKERPNVTPIRAGLQEGKSIGFFAAQRRTSGGWTITLASFG